MRMTIVQFQDWLVRNAIDPAKVQLRIVADDADTKHRIQAALMSGMEPYFVPKPLQPNDFDDFRILDMRVKVLSPNDGPTGGDHDA